MGLDKFWRTAAGLVTLASVHAVSLDAGTHVAASQYVEPVASRAGQSQNNQRRFANYSSGAVRGEPGMDGTILPGYPVRSITVAPQEAPPQFEYLSAGDIYGSVIVVRLEGELREAAIALPPSTADDRAGVGSTPQQQVLEDIRSLTGLSWPRIAKLVGVERQTLFRWRGGAPADLQKAENARTVLEILVAASEERSSQHDIRAWLNRRDPFYQGSPLQLIELGKYEEALFLAMLTPTSVTTLSAQARDISQWEKHFDEDEKTYVD